MKAHLFLTFLFLVFFASITRADDQKKLFLIGSIHNLHQSKTFSEDKFEKILSDINPDLILLEFPTDWFTVENQPNESTKMFLEDEKNKDGGRDGQLAWKYCKTKKIACAAFDIVGRNKFFKENQVFKRLDDFEKELSTYMERNQILKTTYQQLQKTIELCKEQTPEILNGAVCDSAMKLNEDFTYQVYKEAKLKKSIKDPEFYQLQKNYWGLRNKTMADNICSIAKKSNKTKIAVITGVDHHYYLNELLTKCDSAKLTGF